jgi:acetyl-CoA carboxylase carboxyltransferase component
MSPQPTPLPRSPEEKLTFAAHHSGVATLGPDQAAALLLRLAELEAMAQRAREVRDDVHESDDAMRTAQYILEGD